MLYASIFVVILIALTSAYSLTNRNIRKFKYPTALRDVPLELTGKLDPSKSWTVKFVNDDEVKELIVREDTSLLEAAEKIFEDVPSSCRNGVCTTCSARILEGQENVKLAVHGLTTSIIEAGFVCSCQAYATGPGVVIKLNQYDQVYEEQYGKYEKSYEMKYSKDKGDIQKGLF